jgi:hypothetical protein
MADTKWIQRILPFVLELVGYQPPFFFLSDNLISSCLYNNSVESLLEGVSNFIGGTDVCNI